MPNPSNSRSKISNEDVRSSQGASETYVPKAWLRSSPAVTVRGDQNITITFNAALSKALGLTRFRYAAVRHDANANRLIHPGERRGRARRRVLSELQRR